MEKKTLNETIRKKLEEIEPFVFYGTAANIEEEMLWNYIVFNREKRADSGNRTGKTYYFNVNIVRENEIPEELDDRVIEKMLEIPGIRIAGDAQYLYTEKQSTGAVVELMTIPFCKSMKG